MFASLSQEVADACAICTSPSKTFNLAALHNANVFIATPQARKAFQRELDAEGFSQPNIMGWSPARPPTDMVPIGSTN